MTRGEATGFAHEKLVEHNLTDWHVRLTTDMTSGFLGMCSHRDKAIILSAHHIDIHDTEMVKNTILHEIAHALTPGHSHDPIWQDKARAVGCINTQPCSNLSFTPEAIDAIRSGATLEIEIETQVIHTPKYKVTRLQDHCPDCGKVAVIEREAEIGDKKWYFLKCKHLIVKDIPKQTPFDKWISDDADRNCAHEWDGCFCTKCPAKRPLDFQVEGMRAIEKGLAVQKGFGVFDEMGLGKTIQAFGYLKHHPEACPALFIIKSGIIYQFFQQSMVWLPEEFFGQIIRTSKDPVISNFKFYFIPYDLLIPKTRVNKKTGKVIQQGFDIQKLIDRGIKTVILDECQLIKNPDSSRTQQVRKIVSSSPDMKVIALSGTPWKNRGSEFFPVLNMMAPAKFNSHQGFLNRWVDYQWHGNQYKEAGIRNIPAFKEYTKDILIRREYDEVMKEFPEVSRTLHYTEIDAVNQQMYDEEVSSFVKWWNERVIGGEEVQQFFGSENIVAKLARMRHILGLAKIPATLDYVEDFVEETDKKIAVFVHHRDVGQILYDKLSQAHGAIMPVLKLTAELDAAKRFELQEQFNKNKRAILVASTLASGEGINLQTCSDAILHERQWNPANEDQAAPGRFKRVGQLAKHINVVCITGHDTVDDFLHAIIERKRRYFHATMNKGEVPVWNHNDIMRELAEAIVKSASGKKVLQFVKK